MFPASKVSSIEMISRLSNRRPFSSLSSFSVDNPYSGIILGTFPYDSQEKVFKAVESSHAAYESWRGSPLNHRKSLVRSFIDSFKMNPQKCEDVAVKLSEHMGKPKAQGLSEIQTMIYRAETMLDLSELALADQILDPVDEGNSILKRKITREPIGPVLILSPWNYPLLCAINVLIPAILAGNSVLLKHADRTYFIADILAETFEEIGASPDLVKSVHISHEMVSQICRHPRISYVAFTGSVGGGRSVYKNVAFGPRLVDVGLELGGKDAAYISENCDIDKAVEGVVDGAMYNAGQSCCAVERVYVHEKVYGEFLEKADRILRSYKLGDPLDSTTTLGPIAQSHWVDFLQNQVDQAKDMGARVLFGGKSKKVDGKGRFFEPTLITECNHDMSIMVEESFGPILAVGKPVISDEEAVRKINHSPFGLTASIWTKDEQQAESIASKLNVGTVFMNRCDFVDPYLPWSGRLESGKGGPSLSALGFQPLTLTKSFCFRCPK